MLKQYCIHKPTLRHIKFLDLKAQFSIHGNAVLVYLKNCGILEFFVAGQRIHSMFT